MVGVLLCIKTLFLIVVDKVNKWIKQLTLLKYTHKATMIKKIAVHLHFPKANATQN